MLKKPISAKARLQWSTVSYITLFWCLVGVLQALYKSVNYNASTGEMLFAAPNEYSIFTFILINLLGPLIAGFTAAPFIVFYLKERLVNKSYPVFLIIMGLALFAFILILNTSVSWIFYYQQSGEFNLRHFLQFFLLDPYALRNILSWLIVGFITVFMLQISDKYGPGILNKFIRGNYFHPQEEQRIFMFLDLTNSTPTAEKLGNINFFKLLNSYFADMTDSILENHGEIYQYVGDEIVVTWTLPDGLKDSRCINCFFDIERAIENRAGFYQSHFGLVPKFKAGLHLGNVIVGEIGIIKKDICYSGDVVNTTSRILDCCKTYNNKLLISDALYRLLSPENHQLNFTDLGLAQLRGKDSAMRLWAVDRLGLVQDLL